MDDSRQPHLSPGSEGTLPGAAPPSPGTAPAPDAVVPDAGGPDPTRWAGSERDVETQSLDHLRSLGGREVAAHEPLPLDVPRSLPDVRWPKLHGRSRRLGVARVAAPIVFLVAVVAIVILAQHSGVVGGSPQAGHHKSHNAASTKGTKPARKYYVVKAGESLSQISAKTGVTMSQLMELNPQITDQANLRIGLKIKLPSPSQ